VGTLLQDLHYRQSRSHPPFTLAAVLALTLGIASTTAIFSPVNGVVLRPPPYADSEQLVTPWDTNHEKALEHEPISPATFLDDRAGSVLFGVAPADPVTIGGVATLTMTIALIACLVPAWRASRTEAPAALKE
jgi:hypothetical protein